MVGGYLSEWRESEVRGVVVGEMDVAAFFRLEGVAAGGAVGENGEIAAVGP
mgnify:CR=1 FL=1